MTTPLETALHEFDRLRDKASVDLGSRRVDPDRANSLLCAWLSMVLRLGGNHPAAAPWLERSRAEAPQWDYLTHRIYAAHELAPLAQVHRAIEHARDQAFAAAAASENPAALSRWHDLRALARALGLHSPVKLPQVTTERKAA